VDQGRQGVRGERHALQLFPQRTKAEDALTRRGEELLLRLLRAFQLRGQLADLCKGVQAQKPVPLELGPELRDARLEGFVGPSLQIQLPLERRNAIAQGDVG